MKKTYIFTWYDDDTSKTTTMRLNEKQAELINYLYDELAFGEVLEMGRITAELEEETENNVVDLA